MTKRDIENLQTEGASGVEDLTTLACQLGYRNGMFGYGHEIENMLCDNPGMIEAIYNFVLDNQGAYDDLFDPEDEENDSDDDC